MAPLPESNTARWYLDYQVGSQKHILQMRVAEEKNNVEVSGAFDAFLSAIGPLLTIITINGLRGSAAGSSISVDRSWVGPASYGSGAQSAVNRPAFISFVGRTDGARKVKVELFGIAGVNENDYRKTFLESVDVANTLDVLRADDMYWCAIDGLPAVWKNYANVGFNAYYQRKLRKTG